MRVAIVGAGLAGLATAVDLADAGCEIEILSLVRLWVVKQAVGLMEMATIQKWGCMYFSGATTNYLT